jgi:hypothetical protein
MPNKDSLSAFRKPARQSVERWLRTTTTDQGWGMFAPNPPRRNVFMKVVVTDQDDEVWDLRTDVYAEEQKPIPWIWNTRQRKMNRRIIGAESTGWYRKWHARYICRQWALEHEGEMPKQVQLIRVTYPIPKPEETRRDGYYVAEERLASHGRQKLEYTAHCARETMGQLPDFIRERHDLPPLAGVKYRPWKKNTRKKWEGRDRARD